MQRRHAPAKRAARQQEGDTREQHDQGGHTAPEREDPAGQGLTAASPAAQPPAQQHRQHQCPEHVAESLFEQGLGQIEAPHVEEGEPANIHALTRGRQGTQHREVPEEDLQQQRDVAKRLYVDGRYLGHQPVARQARDPECEPEQGGKQDAEHGDQQGVEQTHHEGATEGIGLVVGDEALQDAETGRIAQKIKACGDATGGQIGQGIVDDVEQKPDNRRDGQALEEQRPHLGVIPPAALFFPMV